MECLESIMNRERDSIVVWKQRSKRRFSISIATLALLSCQESSSFIDLKGRPVVASAAESRD